MQQITGISPYMTSGSVLDISCQPSVIWQDTTSNATYASAENVFNIEAGQGGRLAVSEHGDVLDRLRKS